MIRKEAASLCWQRVIKYYIDEGHIYCFISNQEDLETIKSRSRYIDGAPSIGDWVQLKEERGVWTGCTIESIEEDLSRKLREYETLKEGLKHRLESASRINGKRYESN